MLTSVPAGTALAVRISESLSTEKSAEGDTFSGSLERALVIDGKTLAPAGSTVSGVVYHSVRSGKVKGLAELGLRLTSLTVAGEKHSITSQNWFQQAKATKKEDAAWIGGGAAAGALIGGIAGGGKGAAVGAAAGGGAGTAKVLATRGEPVAVASESLVTFKLKEPVTLKQR